MLKPITLTINCEPVSKGRPRTKFVGGHVVTYNPTKTQEAQKAIALFLQENIHKRFPCHIPLKLTVTFFRHKSKWLPKREDSPFRKPDLDNFVKLLIDAMGMRKINDVLITPLVADDAQITTCISMKRWSDNGHGYIVLKLEEDKL